MLPKPSMQNAIINGRRGANRCRSAEARCRVKVYSPVGEDLFRNDVECDKA